MSNQVLLSKISSFSEAILALENQQNLILKLEKESLEAKTVSNKLLYLEKKNKDLNEEKTVLEKEIFNQKSEITRLNKQVKDMKHETEMRIRQIKKEEVSQEEYINMKLQNVTALERIKDAQQKDISLLKQDLILLNENKKEEMRKQKLDFKLRFDELKKSMLEKIKNKDRNVSQVNIEHIDVSTKLTMLQNHQLLIELEYQSQQIQDLILKKEALERRLFELEKDLEIHKEVENVLAEKNKKLAITLKNYVNEKEGKEGKETKEGKRKIKTFPNETQQEVDAKEKKRKYPNSNSIILSLEDKIHGLDKKLKQKELEMESIKINYLNLKSEMESISEKSKLVLKIIEDEAKKIIKSDEESHGELTQTGVLYLNLNEIQKKSEENKKSNYLYEKLTISEKYSLLVMLVNRLSDLFFYSKEERIKLTDNNLFDEKERKEKVNNNKVDIPFLSSMKNKFVVKNDDSRNENKIHFNKNDLNDVYLNKSNEKKSQKRNLRFERSTFIKRFTINNRHKQKGNISLSIENNKVVLGKSVSILNL